MKQTKEEGAFPSQSAVCGRSQEMERRKKEGLMDGWVGRWMGDVDGQMDGWIGRRMDG